MTSRKTDRGDRPPRRDGAHRVQVVPPEFNVPDYDGIKLLLRRHWDHRRADVIRTYSFPDFERRVRRLLSRRTPLALSGIRNEQERNLIVSLARDRAALAGPATPHAVDEFAAAVHAGSPWMRAVSLFLHRHLRRRIADGAVGLVFPPILLVGLPGVGKSAYSRVIADVAGTPLRRIDAGSGTAGFRVSGTERGWGTAEPGLPVQTVLAAAVANPVMIVDEIDKCGTIFSTKGTSTSLVTSLLEHLERSTGAAFECPAYRIPFDLSSVNWILTANDINLVPDPLRSRCRVFMIPKPSPADLMAVYDRLTADIGDRDLVAQGRVILARRVVASAEGMDLRQVRAFAELVASEAEVEVLH